MTNKLPTLFGVRITIGKGLGRVAMKGNEVGFTDYCSGTNFVWGSQTLNATGTNQGNDVLFARFNKNTGACLSLNKIPGNVGFDDYGCALAVDASGDYILGGNFSGTLTFDGGAQITNSGGQSDFFITKFATQACSPLGVATSEFDNLTYYPNPTTGVLKIETSTELQYELYDVQGSLVHKGQLDKLQTHIDLSGFAAGTYVLKLMSGEGMRSVKVVKR
ncbi:MAG: T9SS type A sorting domain-containing protein [Flavobacteriaceae bacterium]